MENDQRKVSKRMIRLLLLSPLIILSFTSYAYTEENDQGDLVAESIGRVLLVNDKTWFYDENFSGAGDYYISTQIDIEYKNVISKLGIHKRVDFFRSIMMHVDLDASYLEDFLLLIKNDCKEEFIAILERFIDKSEKLNRDGPDQKKARRYIEMLKFI